MTSRSEKALTGMVAVFVISVILLLVAVDILGAISRDLFSGLFGWIDGVPDLPVIGDQAAPPAGCTQMPEGILVCDEPHNGR